MSLKIVMLLRLAIAMAAPMQMSLLQQLQGLAQHQMPLQQLTQEQTSLQQMVMQFPLPEVVQQPITLPLMQPIQGTLQQQQLAMQEQMFALQKFQGLQRMGLVPSPMITNTQPILVLYPEDEPDMHVADFKANRLKDKHTVQTGDEDSEVIDAEPTEESEEPIPKIRAVLLMPTTRGIIGDFISQIPFLPFEINVPDTIAWMYNGIAGIIAGIGQSLPFRPQTPGGGETQNVGKLKSIWFRNMQKMPIVVIPLGE